MSTSKSGSKNSDIQTDNLIVLETFGKLRRMLNLVATQQLKHLGIGVKQAILLREIRRMQPVCVADIARITVTDPTAAGRAITCLIEKNWVHRIDHPEDRRRWQVSLTPKGEKATDEVERLFKSLAGTFCDPLNASEKTHFLETLQKIKNVLNKEEIKDTL